MTTPITATTTAAVPTPLKQGRLAAAAKKSATKTAVKKTRKK